MIPSVPFHSARARQLCQGLFLLVLTVLCGAAQAATINFNGGAVSNCTYSSQVYTCSSLPLANWNDSTVIASGYTVKVSSNIDFGWNQALQMSGSASLQSDTGALDLSGINPSNLNVTGGTLVAKTSFKTGTTSPVLKANVSAASVTLGTGTNFTGSLTSSGPVSLDSSVTVNGAISGTTITTRSPLKVTGSLTASGDIDLASGSTVIGPISGDNISTGSPVNLTGNVTAKSSLTLASGSTITGDVTAKTIEIKASESTITGTAAANSVKLGWHGRIVKTITCTAKSTAGCTGCVTNNSGYDTGSSAPVCVPGLGTGPHHIQISHPGTALTCQPQTVTLTACANSACTTPNYTSAVTVALSPGGGNVTFTGSANATVSQDSAGTVDLSITNPSPSPANPVVCINAANNGASDQCAMVFDDKGLSLSLSPANHRAGDTAELTVTALQKVGNNPSCAPLFPDGSINVKFTCNYNNPISSKAAAVPVKLGNTWLAASSSSQCDASGQAVPLNFTSGVAKVNLMYPEVGDVSLNASYSSGALKAVGSTSFIAAPSSFVLTATSLDGSKTGNAVDASSSAFVGAGTSFKVRVEARNSVGTLTKNFGQESSAQAVAYTSSLVVPQVVAGDPDYTWPVITAPVGTFPPYSNGASEANSMTWNEAGIFNLTATNSNYLGTGFDVTGTRNIGRFIPDHFDVSIVSANGVPMACTADVCPASHFAVYSHQPFNVKVSAYGAAGNTLKYYQGAYARDVTLSGWASAGSTTPADQNPPATPSGNSMTGSISAASFVNGVGNSSAVKYQFANIEPSAAATARAAPTNVYVRAINTDNASSARGANSVEPGLRVLSGRLVVAHAYGSELSPMPLQARAQYWTGSSYVNNPADNNQTGYPLNASDLLLANCTKDLASGGACLSTVALAQSTTLLFSGGVAPFRLRAPGKQGSVDVSIKDGVIPFLPSVTGKGTVQFGVYRSGPVLYLREVY